MAQDNRPFIFHKELAAAGPTRITIDGKLRFLQKKKAYVVDITMYGKDGDTQCTYWCENADCKAVIAGRAVGDTFTVVAEGFKESATLVVVGQQGSSVQQPPPRQEASAPAAGQRPAAGASSPPPDKAVKAMQEAKKFVGRNESLVKVALRRALVVRQEHDEFTCGLPEGHPYKGNKMSEEIYHSVFASLLYGAGGAGIADGLAPCVDFRTLEAHPPKPGSAAGKAPEAKKEPPKPQPKCTECKCELEGRPGDPDGICEPCAQAQEKESDDVPF